MLNAFPSYIWYAFWYNNATSFQVRNMIFVDSFKTLINMQEETFSYQTQSSLYLQPNFSNLFAINQTLTRLHVVFSTLFQLWEPSEHV